MAVTALVAGSALMLLKFGVFWVTDSAAALSDALESVINVVAAGVMLYSLRVANRPADATHPYGHGKAEFMAVAFEGAMILLAGLTIAFEGVRRLVEGRAPRQVDLGLVLVAVVGALAAGLAYYVWRSGVRLGSAALVADGKHLLTDAVSTLGVLIALALVRITGWWWLDPAAALLLAAAILMTSWRLLGDSINALMDRVDPDDERVVREILDDEVARGAILGHHKARTRRNGRFCWVDMHIQVDAGMSVAEGHELASRIEHRIEEALGEGNATAHVEPGEGG